MSIRLVSNDLSGAKIRVVGVGGAGGNILNTMVERGIEGVEFIAINTDSQALECSKADVKIQIGKTLTKGLGTGMVSETAAKAVEETREEIERALQGSDMVFITAGMGGGTGTGAAPGVARIAKALDTLVVSIVTKPFSFEGKPRLNLANSGIEKLKEEVDSLIVIPNQKIAELVDPKTTQREAFRLADRVLYNATKGISQIITKTGEVNVDFADVRTIMKGMGDAMIGTGIASGEGRAEKAAQDALLNPLLDEINIAGSQCVLCNISSNGEVTFAEIEKINEIIQSASGEDAKYIMGIVHDESMRDEVMVTVIATGFRSVKEEVKPEREESQETYYPATVKKVNVGRITNLPSDSELPSFDTPSYIRREVPLNVVNDDLSEDINLKKDTDLFEDDGFEDFNFNEEYDKPAFLRRQMD